jgi:hypothetical protein
MAETVRYSQIGREDIRFGRNNFEVTLASGQVVLFNEVDIGYVLAALTGLKTYAATTDLPAVDSANPGRIARVSADGKIYFDIGTAWVAIGIPTGTTGSVLFLTATGIAQDNANFFWDDTNNRLGIGTNSNLNEKINLPNLGYIAGVNAAGNATKKLIGLNASDTIDIGNGGTLVDINGLLAAKQGITIPTGKTLIVTDLTQNGILYGGASGLVSSTGAPTNGQIPIGYNGQAPTLATLIEGEGIDITNGPGTITIAAPSTSFYNRTATLLTINTTAAETTIYSFTLSANDLSTNKALQIELWGDLLNNSSANRNLQIKIKLGATTIFDDTSTNFAAVSVNRKAWSLRCWLANQSSTSLQVLTGLLSISAPTTAATGTADLSTLDTHTHTLFGTSAVNTALDQTFAITITFSASHANLEIRRQYANAVLV